MHDLALTFTLIVKLVALRRQVSIHLLIALLQRHKRSILVLQVLVVHQLGVHHGLDAAYLRFLLQATLLEHVIQLQ